MARNKKITLTWKQYHGTLTNEKKEELKQKAMRTLEWSASTFYAKMGTPEKLKFYEKLIVAQCYGQPLNDFFPEERKRKTKPVSIAA